MSGRLQDELSEFLKLREESVAIVELLQKNDVSNDETAMLYENLSERLRDGQVRLQQLANAIERTSKVMEQSSSYFDSHTDDD